MTSTNNVVDAMKQENINESLALTANVQTSFQHNVDGLHEFSIASACNDIYSYNSNSPSGAIVSAHTSQVDGNSSCGFSIGSKFKISGTVDKTIDETYTSAADGEAWVRQLTYENSNAIEANENSEIAHSTLSSSSLSESDQKKGITLHTNQHNASSTILQSSEDGVSIDAAWNDNDIVQSGGTTMGTQNDNYSNIHLTTNASPSISLSTQKNTTTIVNGAATPYFVICGTEMSPTNGKLDISIVDQVNGTSCKISMGADGNMKIQVTGTIDIEAQTVNMKATEMNISGESGDCKIANVSLLNHVHMETQEGDIVSPQPTKSAAESN